jgi:L-asparaginase II
MSSPIVSLRALAPGAGFPENPPQVEVWRGPRIESWHRGAWVLAQPDGRVVTSSGDPLQRHFARSSIKALQALPLLETEADRRFGFEAPDLALAISSHQAERQHVERALSMLARAGWSARDLRCGAQPPSDGRMKRELEQAGQAPGAEHNNCSGKHAGFLALCRHFDGDPAHYLSAEGAVQPRVARAVAEMCGLDGESLEFGIDGCSAPTFHLPLAGLAAAFARFANPGALPEARRQACQRLARAAAEHPELVAGRKGRLCTDLLKATGGRLFGKVGAEGMYVIGVVGGGLGLAVKLDDGQKRGLHALVIGLLERFELLSRAELEALAAWRAGPLTNWAGLEIGRLSLTPEAAGR